MNLFFIEDDVEILDDIIENLMEKIDDKDNFIDIFYWDVNCLKYLELPKKTKERLSPVCKGFMATLISYLKYINKKDSTKHTIIRLYGIVDQLQSIKRTTCGAYTLYYLTCLYQPDYYNIRLKNTKGNIDTIIELLNTIFVDVTKNTPQNSKDINADIINAFIQSTGIKVNQKDKELMGK